MQINCTHVYQGLAGSLGRLGSGPVLQAGAQLVSKGDTWEGEGGQAESPLGEVGLGDGEGFLMQVDANYLIIIL